MTKGTVKWFDATTGFGFIQPENREKDVFVHRTALEAARLDRLADGQDVGFPVFLRFQMVLQNMSIRSPINR